MKRLGAVDLTNGKVMFSILRFSWPIFVGNAFQQLYNVVDTAVLGRYADYCAMASVGLCFPIIVSVIALFCGIGTGTSVIVSRYRGGWREQFNKGNHPFSMGDRVGRVYSSCPAWRVEC